MLGRRRSLGKITVSAFIALSLLLASLPQASDAQASGSTTTAEIGLGIGLLAYLEQYFVALGKSKGSAGQADAIADAQLPLNQYPYFSQPAPKPTNVPSTEFMGPPGLIPVAPFVAQQSASGVSLWTLRKLRDLVIYDIAVAARGKINDDLSQTIEAAAKAAKQADAAAAIAEETSKNARLIAALADQHAIAETSIANRLARTPQSPTRKAETEVALINAAAAKDSAIIAKSNAGKAQSAARQARDDADKADKKLADAHRPANGSFTGWRTRFEHYRGCWNLTIAQPKSSAPAAPTQPQPSSKTPDDATKSAANPCAALLLDYSTLAKALPFDQIDFASSLSDTSLYQQIIDQDVGSHALNNSFHVIFLFMTAKALLDELPQQQNQPQGRGFDTTLVAAALSSCITSSLTITGAIGCAQAVGGIEQAIAAGQNKRDACAFSRGMWMPKYTSIITMVRLLKTDKKAAFDARSPAPQQVTVKAHIDYGPSLGC